MEFRSVLIVLVKLFGLFEGIISFLIDVSNWNIWWNHHGFCGSLFYNLNNLASWNQCWCYHRQSYFFFLCIETIMISPSFICLEMGMRIVAIFKCLHSLRKESCEFSESVVFVWDPQFWTLCPPTVEAPLHLAKENTLNQVPARKRLAWTR